MANPAWRAAGTKAEGSSTTTISVAPPAGHQSGDLLVLLATSWANPGTTLSTPSGWTLMPNGDSGAWGTSARYRTYVFYKLAASGSEPNVSVVQAASGFPEAVMLAYQGTIDTTTPIDAAAGWGAPDFDTTIPALAITTVTANALVVYLMQANSGAAPTGITPPNSAVQHYQSTYFNSAYKEADITKASPGTLAAADYTISANTVFASVFTFAIRPSVGPAPVADFTATPLTGTAPLSVAFTDTSTNTPTSWLWNFGDGSTSTSQNPSHSYTTSGVFTVTLTATNAGGSDGETKTGYITVGETIAYAAGGGISIW